MKRNRSGFTLMEMLIVIALIAVLIAIAIPVFASQLEKSREATDLANVRAAYAQVSTEAQLGNFEATVTVNLKQKQAGWQSADPVNIGGIVHSKRVTRITGRVMPRRTGPAWSPMMRPTVWCSHRAERQRRTIPAIRSTPSTRSFLVRSYIKPNSGQGEI